MRRRWDHFDYIDRYLFLRLPSPPVWLISIVPGVTIERDTIMLLLECHLAKASQQIWLHVDLPDGSTGCIQGAWGPLNEAHADFEILRADPRSRIRNDEHPRRCGKHMPQSDHLVVMMQTGGD